MTEIQKLERKMKIGKYACIFSAFIVSIGYNISILSDVIYKFLSTHQIRALIVGHIIITIIAWLIFWMIYIVLKIHYQYWIDNEYLKETIPQEYSLTNSFVEICLRDEENIEFIEILKHPELEARYYAKLLSKDEIEVTLKDKCGNLLKESEKIKDFHYFNEKYKTL